MSEHDWIGVDLDGVLAVAGPWRGLDVIGDPVPQMVDRVKQWLVEGRNVRIFTARANPRDAGDQLPLAISTIEVWCMKHLGVVLPITHEKDRYLAELWDDRAIQIFMNAGTPVSGSISRIGTMR